MIACRPHVVSPSPSLESTDRPTAGGGPVFLPPRRPSAYARRLVDELEQADSVSETHAVHGG